jgi:hypothetical protein
MISLLDSDRMIALTIQQRYARSVPRRSGDIS